MKPMQIKYVFGFVISPEQCQSKYHAQEEIIARTHLALKKII